MGKYWGILVEDFEEDLAGNGNPLGNFGGKGEERDGGLNFMEAVFGLIDITGNF